MGTYDQRGRELVNVDEAADIIGCHRKKVFNLIKRGVLVKVKVSGIRAFFITVESIDDHVATQGMSLSELSTRVVQMERELRLVKQMLQRKHPTASLPHPSMIDQEVEEEHDSTKVQRILNKYHPERLEPN